MSMLFVCAVAIYNNYGFEWAFLALVPMMCIWAAGVAQNYHWYK